MSTKPAKTAAASRDKVVSLVTPTLAAPILKLKDFVDRAADRSGVKKKDAKPAIEAALAVLAEAIEKGEELRLPPLGKLKIAKTRDVPGGKMITLKLRTGSGPGAGAAEKDADDPLADSDD